MTRAQVENICVGLLIVAAIAFIYTSYAIMARGYFFESLLPLIPFGLFESAVVYVLEHYE